MISNIFGEGFDGILDYGTALGKVSGLSPILSAKDSSGVIAVISMISMAIATWYVWREGDLMNYIIYIFISLGLVLIAIVPAIFAVWIGFLIFGVIGAIIGLSIVVIPLLFYYSRLVDSWLIAALWALGNFVLAFVGLSPIFDAYMFENLAGGEYW